MREPLRDKERLLHIIDACDVLMASAEDLTLESLTSDRVRFYGYVKLVEIIGEATYKLTKEFRSEHQEVPWRMMESMRHVLVHDYYRITPAQLLSTIRNDVPELRPLIYNLLTCIKS